MVFSFGFWFGNYQIGLNSLSSIFDLWMAMFEKKEINCHVLTPYPRNKGAGGKNGKQLRQPLLAFFSFSLSLPLFLLHLLFSASVSVEILHCIFSSLMSRQCSVSY